MKLREDQLDVDSLGGFGEEAVALLRNGDFLGLANRFGFALALDRDPASAIEADLGHCLSEKGLHQASWSAEPPEIVVKYFTANSTGLYALTECLVPLESTGSILVELIVTAGEQGKFITLEQISGVA